MFSNSSGPGQPAFGRDRQLKLLACGVGAAPIRPSAACTFWLCTAATTSAGRQIEGGQPVGIEPQPQRIIERAKQARLSDAADARQRIDDVDRRVVVEEQRVMGVLRRIDADDLQQRRRFFTDDEALALHLLRQQRRRELGPVLDIDRVDIRIGAEREGDGQRVAAVGAAGRLVIERIVDAVDLLLDRLGDGRLDGFRIGAGIERRQRDLRRHDVGKLRDRNHRHRDDAGQRDDDRDDEGQPRPVDEDVGDHVSRLRSAAPFPARPGPAALSECRRRSPFRLR